MKSRFILLLTAAAALGCVAAQAAGIDVQAFCASQADILSGLGMVGMGGAIRTKGTQLFFVDPEGETPTLIDCITSVGGLSTPRDQIETTCLEDVDRTYESGLGTPGAATFGLNTDPSEASHVRLHELHVAGTKVQWALGWGDGTSVPTNADSAGEFDLPTNRTWITFFGYVSDFPFDFALNDVVKSSVSVQVSGSPVLIPKA